ncbi:LysR family transcriptional regulator [Xylophilus sp. GOD-11R]|uniref:LysR family transcriptional regulator n=1 Tax=Xylophilus sp. GOD-11R TaxID=3089814 RepID=UPI00298CC0A4|nr:LysR family transcriptional regulator [Xylophilus sp. GOD-11R]WPB56278.1 LysR family transcriptional regulator [Xylophilus sp. GOD-11R]
MLKELRTFLAVARHGTFSRTADRIGLTQSAVSAQIQRLEESLGFPLFDRHGRLATLNAAGRETVERAEQLVAMFEQLHRKPGGEDFSVQLRIGAIASVQAAGLPDALVGLRAAQPRVRVRIVPGVSLSLLGMVDAGELDAAVMIRPPFTLPSELAWHPLWSERFVLAVPAGVKGRDWRKLLQQHPFLRYDRASFGGRLVAQFLQAEGLEVQEAVEMDELGGIVKLVANGLGVALLPESRPYFPTGDGVRVIGLGPAEFRRDIGMVERVRNGHAGIVDGLRNALRVSGVVPTQPRAGAGRPSVRKPVQARLA